MYYHGLEDVGKQVTRVALSPDGVHFTALPEVLGRSYFRVFHYRGATYALAMPGQLYRSQDGLSGFEAGPLLFSPDMRHAAVLRRGTQLYVFRTQVGEAPERILLSSIDLQPDWSAWKASDPIEVLRPERDWEGADAPRVPSMRRPPMGVSINYEIRPFSKKMGPSFCSMPWRVKAGLPLLKSLWTMRRARKVARS